MRSVSLVLVAALGGAMGGCAVGGDRTDVPARLTNTTEASRAELTQVVNSATGKSVTLASDALTRSSTLTIERDALKDASGRRIEVREREAPERFRLVKRGAHCVLIQERTQQEITLRSASCVAESSGR